MKKYFIFFIGIGLIWTSCESKREQFILDSQDISPLQFKALPDTLLPPEIFTLTAENRPKPIKIQPKTLPLKYPQDLGQLNITQYGMADGLPSDVIQDLEIDAAGNLWIGSLGFLSKFDGTQVMSIPSPSGFGSGMISNLKIDAQGILWILNFDGLYKFDGQAFENVPLSANDQELGLLELIEAIDGAMWVSSAKGLFKVEDDSVYHFTTEEGLLENYIYSVLLSPDGRILASTKQGVYVFDGKQFVPYLPFPQKTFHLLLTDSENNIWYWFWSGSQAILGRFDGENLLEFGPDEGFNTQSFIGNTYEDRSGGIWIFPGNALFYYREGKFTNYSDLPLVKKMGGKTTIEDDAGNLWIGGIDGFYKIDFRLQIQVEAPIDEGKPIDISDITIDENGVKWMIGERGNQLLKYESSKVLAYDLKPYLGTGFIRFLYSDKNGSIWAGTGGQVANERRLMQFDGENIFFYGANEGLKSDFIQALDKDENGNLIISGQSGIQLFDGKEFTFWGSEQGYPEEVTAYFVDSKRRKWIGSYNQGLFGFQNDSILSIDSLQDRPFPYINRINEDPFGNIWIGSDAGLSKFDGNQLTHFGYLEGLGNVTTSILVDSLQGRLWFGTSLGLFNLPFYEIDKPEPKFVEYSKRTGFDKIPAMLMIGQDLILDSSGIWMSGLIEGAVRFDHRKFQSMNSPGLALQNIRINNSQILWSLLSNQDSTTKDSARLITESVLKFGKIQKAENIIEIKKLFGSISYDSLQKDNFIPVNLSLPHKNNNITFEFSAISPSFGKFTQYRYLLEGYEENWSPFSKSNEASFGNMSEGDYVFRLEALTNFGTISKLSYPFTVFPPWYRTWWAYLIYFIIFLGLTHWVYKIQKRRLIAREREVAREKELEQAKEIEKAYSELKSTQAQLIQSEKMASLGELTAGIAHEIQNPLNFVNNFSELNRELIAELKAEIEKGDLEEISFIAKDIETNEEKINHHGKRAGSIVKGMLEHSRKSDGQKELTDINKLVDESLRLSFHGLRAKDKEFHSDFKLDLDPDLPEIKVIPQDIGRVLLNLINNAFYTVNEKARCGTSDYHPEVIVSTKKTDSGIEISVADNGSGIPNSIKDKIFQPFFTTKPTGSGTGLGLSLSYDIIKAHGGEIQLKSDLNQGAEFIISLSV